MREAARLSGLLRAAAGRPFVAVPRSVPAAAGGGASGGAAGSWEWYTHGAEAPQVLREQWNALAAEVAKATGAEAAGAVMGELVERGATAATRADLERAVGPLPAAAWAAIEPRVAALVAARPPPPAPRGAGGAAGAEAGAERGVAFAYAALGDEDDDVMARALALTPPPAVVRGASAAGPAARPAESGRALGWAADAERDAEWLLTALAVLPIAQTAPLVSVATSVLAQLERTRGELELQHHLFEMLGGDALDLLPVLIKERRRLIQCRAALVAPAARPTGGAAGGGSGAGGRHIVGQVVVQSEAERAAEKARRKEAQRTAKRAGGGADGGDALVLDTDTIAAWQAERHAQLTAPTPAPVLAAAGTLKPSSQATLLPEGARRSERSGYEEVWVPPPKQAEVPPESLVPISAFSELGRAALSAYKTLNRVQSRVFEAAYRTNENLLICAPTGAGKTDIAMMTILHEIEQHWSGGAVRTEEFKIIYVAPMKALATEMVENFTKRLSRLGLRVRELTGDMQLTRKELQETQVIVTTPEKWDVITRKSSDVALTSLVRLLIIDEVHLLHEDRGPVIEAIVARTLRQVEATQSMIRIVGLSATLPNYADVAAFLRVNPAAGLFHFDGAYRPVPLEQVYIGVRESNPMKRLAAMNQIAFDKTRDRVRAGHQVMIFVHSRKDTVRTAQLLLQMAEEAGYADVFKPKEVPGAHDAWLQVSKSRNQELRALFPAGLAMHHAGMLRPDRLLVENLFRRGLIRVIVCTATLAWGVNLPAHTVLIKGTQIYEPRAGTFVDLGMLDVMQIFGRAGRPQFDTSGEGIIVTSHDKLAHYLSLMNTQLPVESQFHQHLADHLNAEVALGSVATIADAEQWLRYTFLHVRMRKNPLPYGATVAELELDPHLGAFTRSALVAAARTLDKARMLRFDEAHATLHCTDAGRVASHFYIQHESVETFNELLAQPTAPELTDTRLFALVSRASEFEQIRIRDEETKELDTLEEEACPVPVEGELQPRKVNILLQAFISQAHVEEFALVSDSMYVAQNAARIVRGLFEMVLKKGWSAAALRLLTLAKMLDRRLWHTVHPLRQFPNLRPDITTKLEAKAASLDRLRDMSAAEIGALVANQRLGGVVRDFVRQFPTLEVRASVQPITRAILKVEVVLRAAFVWNDQAHGQSEGWWVCVEDPERGRLYHSEYWTVQRRTRDADATLSFVVPVQEPLPPQYVVHVVSDRWLGAEHVCTLDFKRLHLPHMPPAHTPLLPLEPLPVSALHNAAWEALYPFTHFNPIQTQAFHTLMYRDCNVLLGAPTGSGKTITAELAMFRLWNTQPQLKVVYVGPLKALVRERMADWERKFVRGLGKRMVELTGDYTPDVRLLEQADIVTTTPEKWDGISRNWRNRSYVQSVGLLVLDEIHLLGEERGPILEVIVSRMRYIAATRGAPVRIVGLSTALANAHDVAAWLGIEPPLGLFNFHSAVRPVPLEVHIQAYAGKHYCPRMATMNKPAFQAIRSYAQGKPALVFVSSRRQTRLTAVDLIACALASDEPHQFLHMAHAELDRVLERVRDASLKHTLQFGIGLHHAGVVEADRRLCEELFAAEKIGVLVSTATLAWGVNLPAHLVVIKGTEFYDAKTRRYVDMPITDVLQMMGRAGRPQFDTRGVAVVMVHEPKKDFYHRFLYEPFPVESSLDKQLHDHMLAEAVSGTVASRQDAVDYLTWTYYFRRLVRNPSYYGLEDATADALNAFLSARLDAVLQDLADAQCVDLDEEGGVEATALGRIASFYYLHYNTVQLFNARLTHDAAEADVLQALCDAPEYAELPVRHNEEELNAELAKEARLPVEARLLDSPHVKAQLLMQAHMNRAPLPVTDYVSDTRSVLEQATRVLQAIVDVAAHAGRLKPALAAMRVLQALHQARWWTEPRTSPALLPHWDAAFAAPLAKAAADTLPALLAADPRRVRDALSGLRGADAFVEALAHVPRVGVSVAALGAVAGGADVTVQLQVTRGGRRGPVPTPLFPKRLEREAYWAVLGSEHGELFALKRVQLSGARTTVSLSFDAPTRPGPHVLRAYLVCDAFAGIDQEVAVPLTVT